MHWKETDQSYIFIVSSRASISKDMSPKESVSPSGGSGATCSAIPWLHLFNLEEQSEASEERDWEHEGVEDVVEAEDSDEDEVEDRKAIEVLVGVDDASSEFCDDTFILVAIVQPDSTTITLVFALTPEGSRVRGWVPAWGWDKLSSGGLNPFWRCGSCRTEDDDEEREGKVWLRRIPKGGGREEDVLPNDGVLGKGDGFKFTPSDSIGVERCWGWGRALGLEVVTGDDKTLVVAGLWYRRGCILGIASGFRCLIE